MTRARTVLCFGDSNTHGQIPGAARWTDSAGHERWPGVMAAALGPRWHVIEEGLSGRTTVRDDPIEGKHKNGRRYLNALLAKPCAHRRGDPDVGTNDLKRRYFQTAPEVAMGIGCLIYDIKELSPGPGGHVPEILVVAPPPMLDDLH